MQVHSGAAGPFPLIDRNCDRAGENVKSGSSLRDVWSFEDQRTLLPTLDDIDLVNRAVGTQSDAPNPEAFGELYARYRPAVFAFALSKLRNFADAEDITAQTFLQALQALPRYQQRGLPILSWLFRISMNLIAGLYRASAAIPVQLRSVFNRDAHIGADAHDPLDPDAAAAIAAWEETEEFRRLLHDLTLDQRMVLWLRFGDDMALAAIARKTGRTEGAVKALQFRGIREVRRQLAQAAQQGTPAGWAASERATLEQAHNASTCTTAGTSGCEPAARVQGGLRM